MSSQSLKAARSKVNDEFFTLYDDVAAECEYYKEYFAGKSILLPCDTEESAFWIYFSRYFKELGLTKLIATHKEEGPSYYLELTENGADKILIDSDGDFFSKEMQEILEQCDIVVTNPPFSREAEMVKLILEKGKNLLLIGCETLMVHRELFWLFAKRQLRVGFNSVKRFFTPEGTYQSFGNVTWITTFPVAPKGHSRPSTTKYDPARNLPYSNYGAINVDRVSEIPIDYDGIMGVPITYLKRPLDNYEILGLGGGVSAANKLYGDVPYYKGMPDKGGSPMIGDTHKFVRVFIRKKI